MFTLQPRHVHTQPRVTAKESVCSVNRCSQGFKSSIVIYPTTSLSTTTDYTTSHRLYNSVASSIVKRPSYARRGARTAQWRANYEHLSVIRIFGRVMVRSWERSGKHVKEGIHLLGDIIPAYETSWNSLPLFSDFNKDLLNTWQ